MPVEKPDQFPAMIVERIAQSAADTLTFDEINIGLNLFDKAGLLLQRLEMTPTGASLALMTAASDILSMGLCTSDGIADLSPEREQIIDVRTFLRTDFGTAGNAELADRTIVADYSTLRGGGLLIPPKPLYWAIDSNGLASVATVDFRMYFIVIRLQDTQYLELLETRRVFAQ